MAKKQILKTGIMGGSFSPFHLAHLNSLLTVRERFALDNIVLVPSFQTPLKREEEEFSPSHRLKMLKRAVSPYPFMSVDDQEILRKGLSYTHQTIAQLAAQKSQGDLFFILGLDQFYIFDLWKNFKKILSRANLIATSRPGLVFPKKLADLPKGIRPLVKKRSAAEISLKSSDKKIYFCALRDMDISSSYIKQRLKEGKDTVHLLPKAVDLYIRENKLLFKDQTRELICFAEKELEAKKAYDIKAFDLRSRPAPFSFGLMASASNTRHAKALANHIKQKITERFGIDPLSEEGREESRWIAFDYGDLIIHIFYEGARKLCELDKLWADLG